MRVAALSALLLLAGCAVTPKIFDPAPFDPTANQNAALSATLAATPAMPTLLTFDSYADASAKLYALQSAYRQESNTISRETPLFDVPLIGLAIATVANPIFHGATAATSALGLGSVAVGGARLYFSPQTKAQAYNAAALSFYCAIPVSNDMDTLKTSIAAETDDPSADLTNDIADANMLLSAGTAQTGLGTLLTVRDQAVAAQTDLNAALAVLDGGPEKLQDFAIRTIIATTNKVVGSTGNIAAATTMINPVAAQTRTSGTASLLGSFGGAEFHGAAPPPPTPAQVTAALQADIAAAQTLTTSINTTWANLTKCEVPTS